MVKGQKLTPPHAASSMPNIRGQNPDSQLATDAGAADSLTHSVQNRMTTNKDGGIGQAGAIPCQRSKPQ